MFFHLNFSFVKVWGKCLYYTSEEINQIINQGTEKCDF